MFLEAMVAHDPSDKHIAIIVFFWCCADLPFADVCPCNAQFQAHVMDFGADIGIPSRLGM